MITLKDCLNEDNKIVIKCNTIEQIKMLWQICDKCGCSYNKINNVEHCYRFSLKNKKLFYSRKNFYIQEGYLIVNFDYISDIEEYIYIPKKCKSYKEINNSILIVNKEKKYVMLKIKNKEFKVQCHKEDKFDWQIGFGLALSQVFGKMPKWEVMREFYRNKNRKLNYKEYAKWCIVEFFKNDMIEINNLKNRVKEINEFGKVDL